ncbi:MAG: tetratricopeptide repeat protein [Bacteroidetes bacterium]|nr:tetratricopeptide repeat protein [Bacteroidota bacterium]
MRKAALVSLFFMFWWIHSSAQKTQADTLELQLPFTKDTARVTLLNKIAALHSRTDAKKSLGLSLEALKLAEEINFKNGIAASYRMVGLSWFYNNDHTKALENLVKSADVAIANEQWTLAIQNYLNLAGTYSSVYGNYVKAMEFYTKALHVCESQNLTYKIYDAYSCIASVYLHQSENEKALDFYMKALLFLEKANDKNSLCILYQNIGQYYSTIHKIEEAESYYEKSLQAFREIKSKGGIITTLVMLSDIYRKRNQLDRALASDMEALAISETVSYERAKFYAYNSLGKTYFEKKEYTKSKSSLEAAAAIALKIKMNEELRDTYLYLAQVSNKMTNDSDAYRYQQLHTAFADSVRSRERMSQLAEMEVRFESERKEKENQLLKKDNDLNKLYAAVASISFLSVVVIGFLFFNRQRIKIRSTKAIVESEKKLLEAELKNSQLNQLQLRKEIDFKNKELTTYALTMVQKNEILEEVRLSIEQILKNTDSLEEPLKKLSKVVDYSFHLDKDWDEFKIFFESVHNDFFVKLKAQFPDLSGTDLKLCALIRLNLNIKQAAAILRISPDSVKIARHRLRKKFNMQTEDNLNGFIMNL